MAQPLDYVEYLTKEIGARPAGTEEEQQAAIYIADEFQKEAGFAAAIEEFTSSSNLEGGKAILAMVTVVVSILAMMFHVLTVPALILALISAVIYVMESYGNPVVSRLLARGASQNVVAKYQPAPHQDAGGQMQRQRKIVLVAHYDTGKVTPGIVRRIKAMGIPVGKISLFGMVGAAFFLLLRLFIGGTGGAGLVFINILTILAILAVAIPIVDAILYRMAPYNEGANNNATGVAALLEVARRIGAGSVSEADLLAEEQDIVVHGQAAAQESGSVPQGTELRYEAGQAQAALNDEEYEQASQEERLLAAKAAIAALTGKSVEQHVYAINLEDRPAVRSGQAADQVAQASKSVAQQAEQAVANVAEAVKETASPAAPVPQAPELVASGFQNAPSWFVAAQQNAKRPESSQPIQRSRYTEAIQAAERELAERDRARQEEERRRREQELRAREAATRAAISAMRQESPQPQAQAEPSPVAAAVTEQPQTAVQPAAQAEREVPVAHRPIQDERPIAAASVSEEALPQKLADEAAEQPASATEQVSLANDFAADAIPDIAAPGTFEDHLAANVDLGDTIAFTPEMIRQAIQEEMEEEQRQALQDSRKEAPDQAVDAVAEQEEEPQNDQEPKAEARPRRNLAGVPAIDQPPAAQVPETTNPSRSGLFRMLRSDVPSLDASGNAVPADQAKPAPLESAMLPKIVLEGEEPKDAEAADEVGQAPEEPAAQNDSESQSVDYDMELPISEDLAAAASVLYQELPELQGESHDEAVPEADGNADGRDEPASAAPAKAGGLFSRFRRKAEEDLQDTPQEWLGVDEDFEAREVGRNRGSWESFRQDDADDQASSGAGGNWQGGAFSRVRLGHVSTQSGENETADEPEELIESAEDHQLNEEIEQIYHFRNPAYNAEIWFVAIGSDTELHDGAKAFAEEHKAELRGAMVIEVESLGLGTLSVASEEGEFKKIQASSRLKRFTRGATEATGIVLDHVRMGADSITTTLQSAGLQVMHLMGIEDGLPALKGSADDILENVDEMVLEENINYLMELLRQE